MRSSTKPVLKFGGSNNLLCSASKCHFRPVRINLHRENAEPLTFVYLLGKPALASPIVLNKERFLTLSTIAMVIYSCNFFWRC